jgi:hypothetical protein
MRACAWRRWVGGPACIARRTAIACLSKRIWWVVGGLSSDLNLRISTFETHPLGKSQNPACSSSHHAAAGLDAALLNYRCCCWPRYWWWPCWPRRRVIAMLLRLVRLRRRRRCLIAFSRTSSTTRCAMASLAWQRQRRRRLSARPCAARCRRAHTGNSRFRTRSPGATTAAGRGPSLASHPAVASREAGMDVVGGRTPRHRPRLSRMGRGRTLP